MATEGRIRVPADLDAVTAVGEESHAALPAGAADRIWEKTRHWYRAGMHPAIQVCLRVDGEVVLNRAIGHGWGNGPADPPDADHRGPFRIAAGAAGISPEGAADPAMSAGFLAHRLAGELARRGVRGGVVVPHVAPFLHVHRPAHVLDDHHAAHRGAAFQGLVYHALHRYLLGAAAGRQHFAHVRRRADLPRCRPLLGGD